MSLLMTSRRIENTTANVFSTISDDHYTISLLWNLVIKGKHSAFILIQGYYIPFRQSVLWTNGDGTGTTVVNMNANKEVI